MPLNKQGWDPSAFCLDHSIGKTTFWAEVKSGRLKVVYCGSKPIVTAEAREAWIAALPSSPETKKKAPNRQSAAQQIAA